MDRAAFLRSLDFLRPLPPAVWESSIADGNNDEEPYSGSTITPPTPSKHNAILLFDESVFVASIEPGDILQNDWSNAGNGRDEDDDTRRKRDRDEYLSTNTSPCPSSIGPAFFQQHHNIAQSTATCDKDTADHADGDGAEAQAMDVDHDDEHNVERGADGVQADLQLQINSDPSLCAFEAAIVKKLPSIFELQDDSVLTTPTGGKRDSSHNELSVESRALLFRFGNRFLFQVDESAIAELKYEPGHGEGVDGKIGATMDSEGVRAKDSPPSKRQRNEGDGSADKTEKVSSESRKLPSSLVISFGSCSFRVFSLEDDVAAQNDATDTTRPSSRVWGALAKTTETVASRLMNARSVLMQQFDIERREHHAASSQWKMAPPGSGLAFHVYPGAFTYSLQMNPSSYKAGLDEDWSYCLGKRNLIECTSAAPSPQKSSTPSKSGTGSSSTNFEHGQKDQAPKDGSQQNSTTAENGSDGKSDSIEKTNGSNDPSELTHESQNDGDEQLSESQPASFWDESVKGDKHEADTGEDNPDAEKAMQCRQGETDQLDSDDEKHAGEDTNASVHETAAQLTWKDEVYKKYRQFATSVQHAERSINAGLPHKQSQPDASHLTSCAGTLSSSYLTSNEFIDASQQCEREIEDTTSEMEDLLEKMFPSRGRKSSAVTSGQCEHFQQRIEELLSLRREAVAAKFALLMTPKR